jgi:pyridoxal phosphate-dependent aminotransferase EpsN
MTVLDERVNKRREIFSKYNTLLENIEGINFMPEPKGYKSSRWLTTLTVDKDCHGKSHLDIIKFLSEHEIESRPLWKPMHMQPVFKGVPYHGKHFDESLFNSGICLPSSSNLTKDEQQEVVSLILQFLNGQ